MSVGRRLGCLQLMVVVVVMVWHMFSYDGWHGELSRFGLLCVRGAAAGWWGCLLKGLMTK